MFEFDMIYVWFGNPMRSVHLIWCCMLNDGFGLVYVSCLMFLVKLLGGEVCTRYNPFSWPT